MICDLLLRVMKSTKGKIVMGDALLQLKTDNSLIQALNRALTDKPSAEELLEQRVSFIYGALDADSGMTREAIKEILVQQKGHAERVA